MAIPLLWCSYIIFLEDGTTGGTARPDGVTKITYEVKTEEGKNVVYASLDGAEAIQYGIFNEDFTAFRTIVGEELTFRLEGVMPNLYNVAYEKDGFELVLYKNGVFIIKAFALNQELSYTGTYIIKENQLSIDGMANGSDMTAIIADDKYTFNVICDNENFSGDWVRNDLKTDNYNPTYDAEKVIYINALYMNPEKTNAISVNSVNISLEQNDLLGSYSTIELENYNKETNAKISVNEDGTVITYNGEEYTLITKAQMNGEA